MQLGCRGTKDSSHRSVTPSVTLTAELNWPIRGKGTQIQVGNKAVAGQQDTDDTKKDADTTTLALVTSELPHTHTEMRGGEGLSTAPQLLPPPQNCAEHFADIPTSFIPCYTLIREITFIGLILETRKQVGRCRGVGVARPSPLCSKQQLSCGYGPAQSLHLLPQAVI